MIVDLPDTTTNELNKRITSLREEGGAITLGRVLTLVVAPDTEDLVEESIDAANSASREHPCRIIVVVPADRLASEARLDGQLRVGGDAGAGEVVVLRTSGPLASHASSVVLPFLLPDTPVVAWWPGSCPEVPAQDPLGCLAVRRITDATAAADPLTALRSRLRGYAQGDTDLAWSRITYWRALLASALALYPPYGEVSAAGLGPQGTSPPSTTSWRGGWPAASMGRAAGDRRRQGGTHPAQPDDHAEAARRTGRPPLTRTGRPAAASPAPPCDR